MKQNELGSSARESESLVGVNECMEQDPEYHGTRETLWEAGGTTLQGETLIWTDSAQYREGKVKRTPGGE